MDRQQVGLSLSARLPHIRGFQCVICGAEYSLDDVQYVCPKCGPVGVLDIVYDYARIPKARPTGGARSMGSLEHGSSASRDESGGAAATHRRFSVCDLWG